MLPKYLSYNKIKTLSVIYILNHIRGGFRLGKMTDDFTDFAAKSQQNYFAMKVYLIFT